MRRLPLTLATAALAVGGGYWGAKTLAPAVRGPAPAVVGKTLDAGGAAPALTAGTAALGTSQAASGTDEQLLLAVLDTLERRPNIAARLRQAVRLGDNRLSGEGGFWQQGIGNQRRTRWELKTLVAGETVFVTQVYDGEAVWTDRNLPGSRQVTRIDMAALRRELESWPEADRQGRAPLGEGMAELLARGGLSQLVSSLVRSFAFGAHRAVSHEDRALVALVGVWRPEQLARIWPGAGEGNWPAHLPHHVLVYIDPRERFPYLVEYRGGDQAAVAESTEVHLRTRDPLASLEFVDVQFAATMPADVFHFVPPDNNFTDVTHQVLAEVRPPTAATETRSARRDGAWR